MKFNILFKTALLLLLAVAGTNTAWADAVDIPQDLGNYITWDKASTNCTVQGDNTYVGNTNGDGKYAEFTITNSTAQSYIMTFATGSTSGNTGHLNVVLTNDASTKVLEAVATVENTDGWTNFNTVNYYSLENLPVGTYTLRISVKDRTEYCGNWSKLAFYSAEQCALPLKSSTSYLEMSTGVFNKTNDNPDNVINYIRPNGYISNILTYNGTEGYYMFNFNLDSYKGYTDSKVRITVNNALTGEQELQTTADASSAGDKMCALPAKLTAGWKTIRFDFLSETAAAKDSESDKKFLYNFRQVNFSPLSQTMPLVGGTPNILDLSVWPTSGNPRYEDGNNNLGYIYNGNTANFYFINENEKAYYTFQAGITANVEGASLKVTITDCATGTTEVEQILDVTKTNDYATQYLELNNAITSGVKNIRFDFIKEGEDNWLYNINNVTFQLTKVSITPANNKSTYVTPCVLNFTDIEGLKAYVATAAANGVVTLAEVGAVPAVIPLMLVGTADTEYTVPVAVSASAPAVNMFRAGDGTKEFDGKTFDYILYTDGLFYQIGSGTVATNKAYLHCESDPTTVSQGARGLRISFGDITGIDQVDNGQVTIDSSQDGKFIENGKLVIVKNGVKYNAAGAKLY